MHVCVCVSVCYLQVGLCLQKASDSLEFRHLCSGTGIPTTVRLYSPALEGAEEARVCQEQRDFIPVASCPSVLCVFPRQALEDYRLPSHLFNRLYKGQKVLV